MFCLPHFREKIHSVLFIVVFPELLKLMPSKEKHLLDGTVSGVPHQLYLGSQKYFIPPQMYGISFNKPAIAPINPITKQDKIIFRNRGSAIAHPTFGPQFIYWTPKFG